MIHNNPNLPPKRQYLAFSVPPSDVNYAEPRILIYDDELRISFSENKRARVKPRL